MAHCVHILNTPPDQRDARKKDGALHIIGSASEVLMKVCLCGGVRGECERVGGCGCVRVCEHACTYAWEEQTVHVYVISKS